MEALDIAAYTFYTFIKMRHKVSLNMIAHTHTGIYKCKHLTRASLLIYKKALRRVPRFNNIYSIEKQRNNTAQVQRKTAVSHSPAQTGKQNISCVAKRNKIVSWFLALKATEQMKTTK